MSADLEEQLKELGPECRAVVNRLRAARTVEPCAGGPGRRSRSTAGWLIAASLFVALGLSIEVISKPRPSGEARTPPLRGCGVSPHHNGGFGITSTVFIDSQPSTLNLQPSPAYGAREYRQTVPEMIASQNPDGSWQNDFLTRRNAEVLARCEGTDARIAYKKAMRNLRAKGVL